ncbi:MAG: hypothetical protein JNL10_13990 [Verrucomicrobiales bacterium]|nr:hypothetical protein [Verrucomicrobiales bacterium]
MNRISKIAFLFEEFGVPSPSQQLLDRFLMGYPRDGALHQPAVGSFVAYLPPTNEGGLERRKAEFNLDDAGTVEQAVEGADAVVIVPRGSGATANDRFVEIAVERAPEDAAVFVHGALTSTLDRGRAVVTRAGARRIALASGTPLAVTWRLPELEIPLEAPLTEALIVVQKSPLQPGPYGTLAGAELCALDGLLPLVERRRGGEAGIRSVQLLEGDAVWKGGERKAWSWPLLAAALSRSHTPQGDPVRDGRTQDLVGLGLVPKLAKNPQAWLVEHRDGFRSAILVLDGVIADFNVAVREQGGGIRSAQLFRAPAPADQQFSLLAAAVETFFTSRKAPWPIERSLLTAGLLEVFRNPVTRTGKALATPHLDLAYRIAA